MTVCGVQLMGCSGATVDGTSQTWRIDWLKSGFSLSCTAIHMAVQSYACVGTIEGHGLSSVDLLPHADGVTVVLRVTVALRRQADRVPGMQTGGGAGWRRLCRRRWQYPRDCGGRWQPGALAGLALCIYIYITDSSHMFQCSH